MRILGFLKDDTRIEKEISVHANVTKDILPIGLLLENRPCLIVGGGRAALRKAEALLASRAAITMVAPALTPALQIYIQRKKIAHIARPYESGDVHNQTIVFAATGNRQINRMVLRDCREARVPCCCVDGNWMLGDFVTPAVIRKDHLSVAISTGGQNCRRSRMIKENLARHLDLVDAANLFVMGVSYQQLPLAEREKVQLQHNTIREIGTMLTHIWGIHGFMLLDTCNRIEIMGVKAQHATIDSLLKRILRLDVLPPESIYSKQGEDAFAHTAYLASGLLSQMTGENHIVSQIKDALALAQQYEWSNGMLKEWIDAALHISKSIRQRIPRDIFRGEIEDAAIDYLCKSLSLPQPSNAPYITVIGTGTVGQGIIERLSRLHIPCHWVYHRHAPNDIPPHITLHAWQACKRLLSRSDGVITAVAASQPILTDDMATQLTGRPVLLMDLATPRNIAPSLATAQTRLVNLDDLKNEYIRASDTWNTLMKQSRELIDEHLSMYHQMMRSFQT